MKLIITSLVLLATTIQCQGGLSLLGGLLSSAQERVHDVAGAVLGTINKGLNFNIDGQFGINGQRQPSYGYQHQEQQNEYESYYTYGQGSYGYRPNQNGVQQPINNNQRPYVPNNNGYNRPTYNGNNNFYEQYGNEHSLMYPNNNYQNSYQNYPNNNNYGYNDQQRPNNPSYVDGNGYSNNQNQGYNYNQNQGYPNNPNDQNDNGYNDQNSGNDGENNVYDNKNNDNNNSGYNNNNSGYNDNNNGYNDQSNFNKPTFEKPVDSGHGTTQGQNEQVQTTTSRPRLTPPTTTPTTLITNANDEKEDQTDTQNSNDDAPLFIPLGQNEYVYGGDTINITAPKRETDNKPQKAEEEEFPIDIRFGDK